MRIRFISFLLALSLYSSISYSQCLKKVNIAFTSVNYAPGCNMNDSGGIDPTIEVFYPTATNSFFLASFDNLPHNMTGPNQTFPDIPICSYSPSFILDEFPYAQTSQTVRIDIYEKDSNFFNDDCSGYNVLDDDYGTGNYTFDFTQTTGTIDVGSCISFNYRLDVELIGNERATETGPLCPGESITINNEVFDISNMIGQVTLPGVSGECDTILDVNLTFYQPDPIAITGPDTFCPTTSFTLSANDGYTDYKWSSGEITKEISNTLPGVYTVTVTTTDGCILEESATVDTFAREEINILGEEFLCNNSTTQLTVNAPQVEWSTGSTDNSIIISTEDIYIVTITDANGCESSKSISITEEDPLPIVIDGPSRFCTGDKVSLEVIETYADYKWSTTENGQTIEIDRGGTYTVTVTDSKGCTNEAEMVVIEDVPPSPTILGETSFCTGETIVISGDDGYDNYEWNTSETEKEITIDATGDYTLTVTDINGCTASTSISIIENQLPTPNIIGALEFCTGESTDIATNDMHNSYAWSTGDDIQRITITQPDDISVTVTDENGCIGVDAVTIVESSEVIPQIISDLSVCIGSSTELELGIEYADYSWSTNETCATIIAEEGQYAVTVTDTQGCTGSTSVEVVEQSELSPEILGMDTFCAGVGTELSLSSSYNSVEWNNGSSDETITVMEAGTYIVTVSDINGCTGSTSVEVEERSELSPEILGMDVFCEGEANELSLSSNYDSYSWSTGDELDYITVTQSGQYIITVTDAEGCTGSASFVTTVIPPSVTEIDSFTCNPNIVGQIETTQTNVTGCDDIIITNIILATEFPDCLLRLGYRSLDVDCPELQNGKFQLVSAQGEYPIEWTLKDSNLEIIGTGTVTELSEIIDLDLAVGSYTMEMISQDFLVNDIDFEIKVKELDFSTRSDTTIRIGESVDLYAMIDSSFTYYNVPLTYYNWYVEDEALCQDDCSTLAVSPDKTTIYRFEFLTELGCTLSKEVTITVLQEEEIYIPNTFSLSSPAPNNKFNVFGPGVSILQSMQIYDRWGNIVYDLQDTSNPQGWNGQINNQNATPGLYLYQITYGQNGKETTLTGQLTLLP